MSKCIVGAFHFIYQVSYRQRYYFGDGLHVQLLIWIEDGGHKMMYYVLTSA